ncbi:hypothetical protein CRUP_020153 [Coryphaenoides rupestris]|nr:hypothetical protein CRUP_020153 [Coryphaenoides rupestris]
MVTGQQALSSGAADHGLSQQPGSVEQISLHCSEGTLDWLYPQGALRLSLSPRLPSAAVGPGAGGGGGGAGLITACVKPSRDFHGAQLYLERDGVLELLLGDRPGDGEPAPPARVRCFSRQPGERLALFLQATPHQDISRPHRRLPLRAERGLDGAAVARVQPLVRGNIRSVEEDENLRAAVIKVTATRVFRQKYALFTGVGRLTRRGDIRTFRQCGVRPGPGSFLFTGRVHFGEAWLGCAPRYKDFLQAYLTAKEVQQIPCELAVD